MLGQLWNLAPQSLTGSDVRSTLGFGGESSSWRREAAGSLQLCQESPCAYEGKCFNLPDNSSPPFPNCCCFLLNPKESRGIHYSFHAGSVRKCGERPPKCMHSVPRPSAGKDCTLDFWGRASNTPTTETWGRRFHRWPRQSSSPGKEQRDAALPNAACTVTVALNQAGFFNLEGCVTFDSRLLPRRSNSATSFTHCKLESGWRASATWVLSSAPSCTLRAKLTPVKTKICSEEISKHWPFFPIATDFLHFFAAKVLPCFWQDPCFLTRHSSR